MSERPLSGRCLCGAVRFEAKLEHPQEAVMDACHCASCRRWSGGPMMTVSCAPDIRIEGADNVGTYESSVWAERQFCKKCGSVLFWRMKDSSLLAVSAQAFDDPAQFNFKTEIFVDEQPANYAFANATRKMTGAEVVAQFEKKQA